MKQSTKRVVGWGTGVGIGVALLVLVAVLIMILTSEPSVRDETAGLEAVQTQAGEETATCEYSKEWIGKPVDEAAVKKAAKAYRILPPGSAMTMDHSPTRVNVETDDKGIVVRVFCG